MGAVLALSYGKDSRPSETGDPPLSALAVSGSYVPAGGVAYDDPEPVVLPKVRLANKDS